MGVSMGILEHDSNLLPAMVKKVPEDAFQPLLSNNEMITGIPVRRD